jgi:hypothetical protein
MPAGPGGADLFHDGPPPGVRAMAWIRDRASTLAAMSGDFDHSIAASAAHRPWPMPRCRARF